MGKCSHHEELEYTLQRSIIKETSQVKRVTQTRMKQIPLTQNKYAIVDDEDYISLSKHKWFSYRIQSEYFYAGRKNIGNSSRTIAMHRIIMNAPKGMDVDHINHDTLDNRKCNLRVCTHAQNLANSRIAKNNKSGYKGVSFNAKELRWRANIRVNNKPMLLGVFKSKLEAARVYNEAAKKYFGKFAVLNNISE